jgi:hypothetical protein
MKIIRTVSALAVFSMASLCQANDFPTSARVEFVMECMRDHTGGQFELLNKCSCAIDRLAGQYKKYDAFVEAQTMAKAVTIAGERGSTLRDNEDAQKEARRYRASVLEAGHACFLH